MVAAMVAVRADDGRLRRPGPLTLLAILPISRGLQRT
jgi:hypothetical protein